MKYIIFLFSILALVGCKSKKQDKNEETSTTPSLKVTVQPYFGNDLLYLDSIYRLTSGDSIKFTDIRFYITELTNANNDSLNRASLFNYRVSNTNLFTASNYPDKFKTLKGYLGVFNDNHKDPSAFPLESPLNVLNTDGMHWAWSSGYSFVQIEAKADTLNDGIANFNHNVVLHVGLDEYLRNLNYTYLNWKSVGSNSYHLPFKLDMKLFFENQSSPINIRTLYQIFSATKNDPDCILVMQNFRNALNPL